MHQGGRMGSARWLQSTNVTPSRTDGRPTIESTTCDGRTDYGTRTAPRHFALHFLAYWRTILRWEFLKAGFPRVLYLFNLSEFCRLSFCRSLVEWQCKYWEGQHVGLVAWRVTVRQMHQALADICNNYDLPYARCPSSIRYKKMFSVSPMTRNR